MHTKGIRMLFLLVCLGCLFLCSCGLDEYYVIDKPTCQTAHRIDQDDQMWYLFSTTSVSALSSAQVSMKGTAVYYKLYPISQESDLETVKATVTTEIDAVTSANSEFSENGMNKIKNTYSRMLFGSNEFLSTSSTAVEWKMTINSDLTFGDGTGRLKLFTAESGSSSLDVYIDKPAEAGEYFINAYAVTVGDVSLQEHYSALAHLGVLKFTIQ